MSVAPGTEYGFQSAWRTFVELYEEGWARYGKEVLFGGGLLMGSLVLLWAITRKNVHSFAAAVVVLGFVAILAAMLLPALGRAKSRASRVSGVNNLKQIALAARLHAQDNADQFPASLAALVPQLGSEAHLTDPETGLRFTYVGAGKSPADPTAILAHSPSSVGGRWSVAFADGSVQILSDEGFSKAIARDQAVGADHPPGPREAPRRAHLR